MAKKGDQDLIKLFMTNTGYTVDEIYVREFRRWLGKDPRAEDKGWLQQKMVEYLAGNG